MCGIVPFKNDSGNICLHSPNTFSARHGTAHRALCTGIEEYLQHWLVRDYIDIDTISPNGGKSQM